MVAASVIIVVLIVFTGLYVAAEFAAVSARRSRVRRLAEDGTALAARLLPVLEDPRALDRYIAASQVGITLCSLILGAYGQATLAPRLAPLLGKLDWLQPATVESASVAIVLVFLTTLAVILGELVPKSLALQNPTRTALFTVLPMQWSIRAFSWSITLLNGSGVLLLRALRLPATGHRHVHSPEEIALLIAESRDGGLLEPREQVRLHRALRLGLRSARQLMVPRSRLAGIDASLPFEEVLRIVAASPYSRLPVYQASIDNIVGILHTKDVVMRYVRAGGLSVASLMRPIVRVPDTMAADRLLTFLRERRSHQALVVDVSDLIVGLITLEDVVAELLGGVADEFKSVQARPIRLSDGRLRLPGAMRLDQAAPLVGSAWRGGEGTVGDRIVAALGRVPEAGEDADVDGLHVEVEAVEAGAVVSVIVGDRPGQDENENS
jgi:putative hemolysin